MDLSSGNLLISGQMYQQTNEIQILQHRNQKKYEKLYVCSKVSAISVTRIKYYDKNRWVSRRTDFMGEEERMNLVLTM